MKDYIFRFFIVTSILIIIISLVSIFMYWDILALPDHALLNYMDRDREYWDLYLNSSTSDKDMTSKAYKLKLILGSVLALESLYLLFSEKYKDFISKKEDRIIRYVALSLFLIQKYITYRHIYYYRLSMIYFSIIIWALAILAYSILISRRINEYLYKSGVNIYKNSL